MGGGSSQTTVQQRDTSALQRVQLPSATELQVELTRYVIAGELTPREAEAILQKESELRGLEVDPELQAAQYEALAKMKVMADQGFDMTDKAKALNVYDQMMGAATAARKATQEQAQRRGIGGSGLELAEQMLGSQQAAQMSNRYWTDIAAASEQARKQALGQYADMATGMRTQEFGEKSKIAEAQDLINRFNAAQQAATQEANINRAREADIFNLTNQQDIANKNVDLANKEAMIKRENALKLAELEMQRAQGIAGGGTTTSTTKTDNSGQLIGSGIGAAATVAAAVI